MSEIEPSDGKELEGLAEKVFEGNVSPDFAVHLRDFMLAVGRGGMKSYEEGVRLVAARIRKDESAELGTHHDQVAKEVDRGVAPVEAFLGDLRKIEQFSPDLGALASGMRNSMSEIVIGSGRQVGYENRPSAQVLWNMLNPRALAADSASAVTDLKDLSDEEFRSRCKNTNPAVDNSDLDRFGLRLASVASDDREQVSRLLMALGIKNPDGGGQGVSDVFKYADALDAMMPAASPRIIPRQSRTIETESSIASFDMLEGTQLRLRRTDREVGRDVTSRYTVNVFASPDAIYTAVKTGAIPAAQPRKR